jgi:F-type H+-transporting ATPase subunit c
MKKHLMGLLMLALFSFALSAQETAPAAKIDATPLFLWTIIIGGIALAVAAAAGAFAQTKAISTSVESVGRNPAAADSIRTLLILGLAFIESLVIYVLLIDLILFFVKWGKYTVS